MNRCPLFRNYFNSRDCRYRLYRLLLLQYGADCVSATLVLLRTLHAHYTRTVVMFLDDFFPLIQYTSSASSSSSSLLTFLLSYYLLCLLSFSFSFSLFFSSFFLLYFLSSYYYSIFSFFFLYIYTHHPLLLLLSTVLWTHILRTLGWKNGKIYVSKNGNTTLKLPLRAKRLK